MKSQESRLEEQEQRYCEFCGNPLNQLSGLLMKRKYCSDRCREVAARRRISARLGIPSRRISKLSNPLFFD